MSESLHRFRRDHLVFPEQKAVVGLGLFIVFAYLVVGVVSLPTGGPSGAEGGKVPGPGVGDSGSVVASATVGSPSLSPASLSLLFGLRLDLATAPGEPASAAGSLLGASGTSPLPLMPASVTPVVASASGLASGSIRPVSKTATPTAVVASPPAPADVDLGKAGFKLRGIIHDRAGQSAVFLYDPQRKREVVLIQGNDDPIRILEVGNRSVRIQTSAGRGLLQLSEPQLRVGGEGKTPTPGLGAATSGQATETAPLANRPTGSVAVGGQAGRVTGGPLPAGPPGNTGFQQAMDPRSRMNPHLGGQPPGPPGPPPPPPAPTFNRDFVTTLFRENALQGKLEQGRWTALVGQVQEGTPLQKFGVLPGDQIIAVGDRPLSAVPEMPAELSRIGKDAQEVTVLRGGQLFHLAPGRYSAPVPKSLQPPPPPPPPPPAPKPDPAIGNPPGPAGSPARPNASLPQAGSPSGGIGSAPTSVRPAPPRGNDPPPWSRPVSPPLPPTERSHRW